MLRVLTNLPISAKPIKRTSERCLLTIWCGKKVGENRNVFLSILAKRKDAFRKNCGAALIATTKQLFPPGQYAAGCGKLQPGKYLRVLV